MQKKSIFYILIIIIILGACNKEDAPTESSLSKDHFDEMTGVVGYIDKKDKMILVIPNVRTEIVKGQSKREVMEIARENNGSWFWVDNLKYSIGQAVLVRYGNSQKVLESNPPIQGGEVIKIVEEE